EVADVTVAYLHETDENETIDFGPLNELCEQVHRISLDTTFRRSRFDRLSRWRRRLHQLTTRRPLRVTLGLSERLSHLVQDLAPKMSVIHVSRLVMAGHVEQIASRRGRPHLVLDLDDIETVTQLRQLQTLPSGRLTLLLGYLDLVRLIFYQRKMLKAFDRV